MNVDAAGATTFTAARATNTLGRLEMRSIILLLFEALLQRQEKPARLTILESAERIKRLMG